MSVQSNPGAFRPRSVSLTTYVSLLLMLATILPLLVTVLIVLSFTRPTLVDQAGKNMQADASTHTQLIDNFFAQQLLEADAVSRLQPIQQFLGGDKSATMHKAALESLTTGRGRGSFYEDWSLLDLQGNVQLFYPTAPQKHGKYYIDPAVLKLFQPANIQDIQARSAQISDVFYSPVTHEAYVDVYAPVFFSTDYHLVGILRATFDLHYIWQIVTQEANVNGEGSYAFILDQRGVVVAQTNPDRDPFTATTAPMLFKSASPLTGPEIQNVQQLGIYGAGQNVPVLDSQGLADARKNGYAQTIFQMKPPGQQDDFQVAFSKTYTVPWSYFVLSPLNNVTGVADNLLRITLGITAAILVLAAVIGLGMGRRITLPIMRSVESLRNNSISLKTLAAKEHSAASQQTWVVDSSQVGLKSVQYYTNAASMAIQRLTEVGGQLVEHWDEVDGVVAKRVVTQILNDVQYLDKAIQYQLASNKKLESAIKVTVNVNDQLAAGASSATEAAAQLEAVVDQLRQVVGR